jgi:hypothetical protein
MSKKKCAVCNWEGGKILGADLYNVLTKHCAGHTGVGVARVMCEDCLFEYFMDSQWSIGWGKRADFLYSTLAGLYALTKDGLTSAKSSATVTAFTAGTAALVSMCIKCNGSSSIEVMKADMPEWLLKINEDYLSQYVPKKEHNKFDNLLCEKCIVKHETVVVRAIPKNDLPLHITDEWFTEKAKSLFEKRLRGS